MGNCDVTAAENVKRVACPHTRTYKQVSDDGGGGGGGVLSESFGPLVGAVITRVCMRLCTRVGGGWDFFVVMGVVDVIVDERHQENRPPHQEWMQTVLSRGSLRDGY